MKANELLKRIESKSAPVIIDACTEIEFKRCHVPGVINAPGRPVRELTDLRKWKGGTR
jgi:rhodanese-related sulfurtransferase